MDDKLQAWIDSADMGANALKHFGNDGNSAALKELSEWLNSHREQMAQEFHRDNMKRKADEREQRLAELEAKLAERDRKTK